MIINQNLNFQKPSFEKANSRRKDSAQKLSFGMLEIQKELASDLTNHQRKSLTKLARNFTIIVKKSFFGDENIVLIKPLKKPKKLLKRILHKVIEPASTKK